MEDLSDDYDDWYPLDYHIGDTVVFTGCSEAQQRWGNHASADHLIVGNSYVVEDVEVHSQHTKVWLVGEGGSFNSVCFEAKE